MLFKKKDKRKKLYIPLEDIKQINDDFLTEMERVKARLSNVQDKQIIEAFHEVLLTAYNAAIEIKMLECEVDYDIKRADIEARRRELKPWRRWWIWKLLFQPLTNRAQDIIEERAEVDADIIHTAAEEKTAKEREKLSDIEKKLIKSAALEKLKKAIKEADSADMKEAFNEPSEPVQANTDEPAQEPPQDKGQLPGQITLEDVQKLPPAAVHRARPPRSCRKP